MRTGFIGLGNIGMPMAANLLAGGFPLVVYDARAGVVSDLVAKGATAAGSPRDVAMVCEIIEVCVRDDAQVREVVAGADGILHGARAGSVIAVHSTIRPDTVRDLADIASRRGVALIDAPITGGAAGAEARALCYMVGGDAEVLERCRPIFDTSASRIVHTGPLGSGAATKLCNNLMMYMGFQAADEAMTLAAAAGVDPEVLLQVTRANAVMTAPMEAYLGLRRSAEHGLTPEFRPVVESFAELAAKDLELALETARDCGVELPGTERCRERMRRVYGLRDE